MPDANSRRELTGKGLLTQRNSVLAIIEIEPQMLFGVASADCQSIIGANLILAKSARSFDAPTVLSSVESARFSGASLPQVQAVFTDQSHIERCSMNAWDNAHFERAVLATRASVHMHAGEFAAASSLIAEASVMTEATGNAPVRSASLALAAWRGDQAGTLKMSDARVQNATATGEERAIGLAAYGAAVLYNGLGRYAAALTHAKRACEHDDVAFFGFALVELVEAASRVGAHEVAADTLRRLAEQTHASGTDFALGVQARSRALLSDGQTADALYREAVERLGRARIAVHLARAHLVYGEWLRREHRRVDAREQLRLAYEMLSSMGAGAFAERARRELRATGETVQKRTAETRDVLTAQEALIARLAAEGRTNPEIGSELFISPRTAEYHLRKVFTKLGISSRRALRDVLPTSVGIAGPT